jgi:uncharacterized protein YndB with AHSA1/START domain
VTASDGAHAPSGEASPSPHAEELAFEIELGAAPAVAFGALTEATHLERWFCDRAASDARTLGRLTLEWARTSATSERWEGRWTLVDPPRACVYEGGHAGYPDRYSGRVRFTLAPLATGTRLFIVHQFPAQPAWAPFVARYRAAWPRALARLAAHLDRMELP